MITVAFVLLAIVVSLRFGRSLPDNQPDRDNNIKSLVGEWAVTGASGDGVSFEFPVGLPTLTFESNDTWESVTECAVFTGTVSFDGVDPIGPQTTGTVAFEPMDADGLQNIGCEDVEVLVEAMVGVDRWEWRGGDMRLFSADDDAEFMMSPVL